MRFRLLLALLLLPLCAFVEAQEMQMEQAIYKLVVNQVQQGEIFALLSGKDVLLSLSDFENAGLTPENGKVFVIDAKQYISLNSLSPNLTYTIDQSTLVLTITAKPSLFKRTVTSLATEKPAGLVYSQNSSFFFNYALTLTTEQTSSFFGEAGYSNAGNLLYSSFNRNFSGGLVRSLTNYTASDPENLTQWVAGDAFVTSVTPLGGSELMGGVSYGRDFALDPYFIRYPTYGFSGAVTVPSIADVYVNGVFVKQVQLPPGTFNLTNLLVPAGSGNTTLVIRNIYGQQQVVSPFYSSIQELAKGLSDYSFNLGYQRNDLDSASWDYGPLLFLGRYREGITDNFTGGIQLETKGGVWSGQLMTDTKLPFADMEIDLGESGGVGFEGSAANFALSHFSPSFSIGAELSLLSNHFANISLAPLEDRALLTGDAFIGFPAGKAGSIRLEYRDINYRDAGKSNAVILEDSVPLGRQLSLVVSADREHDVLGPPHNDLFVSLGYFFGGDSTASITEQDQGGQSSQTLQVVKSAPLGVGLGYRASITTGVNAGETASVQYQAPFGVYEVDAQSFGGVSSADAILSGGVAAVGGSVFAARPIQQGFALVQVPGVPGVTVNFSNQEAGKTDASGNVLIPNILPYFGNDISIVQHDIPIDYRIDDTKVLVAAPYRGGAFVKFPVYRFQALDGSIVLVLNGKDVVPAYGDLSFLAGKKVEDSPLGEDGEFYFENVPPGDYTALVQFNEKGYKIVLHVPSSKASEVDLGTLRYTNPEVVTP